MEEGEQKIPKHSSGVNILIRIDGLWRDTHSHSRTGLFSSWNSDLDRIWLELARDIKTKDFENKEKTFLDFKFRIIYLNNIRNLLNFHA